MSIIDEALKKTQRELHEKQNLANEAAASQSHQNINQILQQTEGSTRRTFPLIFLILFTVLLALLVIQTLHPYKKKHAAMSRPAPAQVSVHSSVPEHVTTLQGLRLQGVMASDNQRIALINQGTYRVGDHIRGYAIASIEDDQVVLRKGKMQYHLKLTA